MGMPGVLPHSEQVMGLRPACADEKATLDSALGDPNAFAGGIRNRHRAASCIAFWVWEQAGSSRVAPVSRLLIAERQRWRCRRRTTRLGASRIAFGIAGARGEGAVGGGRRGRHAAGGRRVNTMNNPRRPGSDPRIFRAYTVRRPPIRSGGKASTVWAVFAGVATAVVAAGSVFTMPVWLPWLTSTGPTPPAPLATPTEIQLASAAQTPAIPIMIELSPTPRGAGTPTATVVETATSAPTPNEVPPTSTPPPLTPTATSTTAARDARAEALLAELTLQQKVGQLLMYGFIGTTASSAQSMIWKYQPGAVILVQNAVNKGQTATLTRGLQDLARAQKGVPPIIAIDHEGGYVQRIRADLTFFPSKLVLGATASEELARLEGGVEGRELKAVGIDMSLGPVVDVDAWPTSAAIGAYERSLGSDPQLVSRLAQAYVEALQAQGVMAVAKHFPGHGSIAADSHKTLPTTNRNRATLDRVDLAPYRQLSQTVGGVMAAHVVFTAVDSKSPASLSHAWLTDVLRGELNFQGLIMTDALTMAAISAHYPLGEAAVQAVKAGADFVMVVGDSNNQAKVYAALLDAARRGEISPARLDESVRRILRAKIDYGLIDESTGQALPQKVDANLVPDPRGADAVRQISDSAITLVRNVGSQVPLPAATVKRALVISNSEIPASGSGTRLGQQIRQRVAATTELTFDSSTGSSTVMNRALDTATSYDLVVVGTYDAGAWQQSLIQKLRSKGVKPVVIGFWRPEELAKLPRDVTYLAAYSPRESLVDAAVRVLFGEVTPTGQLPVDIPGLFKAGDHAQE